MTMTRTAALLAVLALAATGCADSADTAAPDTDTDSADTAAPDTDTADTAAPDTADTAAPDTADTAAPDTDTADTAVTAWLDAYRTLPDTAPSGPVVAAWDDVDDALAQHRGCLADTTEAALVVDTAPAPDGVAAGYAICDRAALDWINIFGDLSALTGDSAAATVSTDWPVLAAVVIDHTVCVAPAVAAALAADPDAIMASYSAAHSPAATACTWTASSQLADTSG